VDVTGHRRKSRERSLTELVACGDQLMAERFRESAKSQGLSVTEGRVLGALTEFDGIRMIGLAELALSNQTTLSKAVDRLERAQLVQRRTPSEDRRVTLVYLTAEGRRVATLLLAQVRKDARAVTRALGPATSRKIKAALARLVGLLQEPGWRSRIFHPRRK
jgi:DNA-binding MarR family transcriptional regulator